MIRLNNIIYTYKSIRNTTRNELMSQHRKKGMIMLQLQTSLDSSGYELNNATSLVFNDGLVGTRAMIRKQLASQSYSG